ncbi:MAG: hypothetical protein SOU88_03320 [Candidatus Treponema excrementipullorum]|nr:hypothetical protein [Candidatus Treponema excrementipullorum]
MSEHSVCYLFGKERLLEQEKCRERKRYEVRLERTAINEQYLE